MSKIIVISVFLFSNCQIAYCQSESFSIGLINGNVYCNELQLSRNMDIEKIIEIIGRPTRTKKRIHKDLTTKEKSKWIDYYFDSHGIKISESIDSNQLISFKLSFVRITNQDPKHPYLGRVFIDDLDIDTDSRESDISSVFSGMGGSQILSLYLMHGDNFQFLMSYKYGGKGIQDIIFTIKE